MQHVELIKVKDAWLARVTLEDGKAAHMSLSAGFSDAEALAFNQTPASERNAQILQQLMGPIVLDETYVYDGDLVDDPSEGVASDSPNERFPQSLPASECGHHAGRD